MLWRSSPSALGVFGLAFSTLAYGAFADRYGRRPVLLVGLAAVPHRQLQFPPLLLVGRIAHWQNPTVHRRWMRMTLARAIARDVYGDEGLVKSIAYLTMFYALGALVAPGFAGF